MTGRASATYVALEKRQHLRHRRCGTDDDGGTMRCPDPRTDDPPATGRRRQVAGVGQMIRYRHPVAAGFVEHSGHGW
jgi:hypothetical protein